MRLAAQGRSWLILAAAHVAEAVFPMLRAVGLARSLSPEQFGLAVLLSVVFGTAELVADMGLDRMIMRLGGPNGTAAARGTIHAILVLRGIALAGLLILVAIPLASALGAPEAAGFFCAVGLAPLIRAFQNLTVKESMLAGQFVPDCFVLLSIQAVWTAVTLPLVFVVNDCSVMVYGLLIGQLAGVIVSHLIAPHRWGVAWDRAVVRETVRFGTPLMLNGVALTANGLADRIFIGVLMSPTAVATYSALTTLAVNARGILTKPLYKLAFPAFVTVLSDPLRSARIADVYTAGVAVTATAAGVGFVSLGAAVIGLLFGSFYAPSQLLVLLVAVSLSSRILMTLPVPPALAAGDTRFVTIGTLIGSSALLFGGLCLVVVPSLPLFLAVVATVEVVGTIAIVARTVAAYPFGFKIAAAAVLVPLAATVGLGTVFCVRPDVGLALRCVAAGGIVLTAGAVLALVCAPLRAGLLRRAMSRSVIGPAAP